jgi:N-acyl-phosphatidylethanolamine-hydrolysing phospholipase D
LSQLAPHLTWIGHATFVMRLGGQLIATDPIWSERIQGAIKRNVQPGVALDAVPPLDLVTISHSHFDHLDLPTLRRIGRKTTYIVPRDCADILVEAGLPNVIELGWWESVVHNQVKVTLVPAQHWSMRMPWDRNTLLWGGFVFEAADGSAYHAGDTAYSEQVFRAVGARFPNLDWAMLPIGAYDPVWFMGAQHMGPEEALRAFELLGARRFVAMHWGTFKLTDEPFGEPPLRLRAAWENTAAQFAKFAKKQLVIPDIGETQLL